MIFIHNNIILLFIFRIHFLFNFFLYSIINYFRCRIFLLVTKELFKKFIRFIQLKSFISIFQVVFRKRFYNGSLIIRHLLCRNMFLLTALINKVFCNLITIKTQTEYAEKMHIGIGIFPSFIFHFIRKFRPGPAIYFFVRISRNIGNIVRNYRLFIFFRFFIIINFSDFFL